ncbi:hypothetical protein BDN67DRAFT_997316 [Paxillus ammoniavirescens]|nr:hypothetical protein BDN67DRAFT_997316 [Paxillus ammoniavirescens]
MWLTQPSVPVQSIFNATAITIDACYSQCGTGQEPFEWETFSQDFGAWLLPYLALISQLPFGGKDHLDNLMSAVLTVGPPTLAGYSLFLTLLNTRWINRQFSHIDYPTRQVRKMVVRVLSSLQQVPLQIRPGGAAVFESLVILPENDKWWETFYDSLNYTHTWSISSAMSITWVIIAYLLTIADSLSNVIDNINSNGQGTGSVWLWLLPIVIGWLVLAPKCAYDCIIHAYDRANECIVVVEETRNTTRPNLGLIVEPKDGDLSSPDEARTPPVFNYSRALLWSRSVYIALLYYDVAWSRAQNNQPVHGTVWNGGNSADVPDEHWKGVHRQIMAYCQPLDDDTKVDTFRLAPEIIKHMILASLMSLALQWATTGAAVLAVWFTPTMPANALKQPVKPLKHPAMMTISDCLHWAGKTLASVNATFIIIISIFQHANFFDQCYCNLSILSHGGQAYDIVVILYVDIAQVKAAWIGGFVLAFSCSAIFVGLLYLLGNSLPA